MHKLKITGLAIVLALLLAAPAAGEEAADKNTRAYENATVYDRDYRVVDRVRDGRILDRDYRTEGYIRDGNVYDRDWNRKGRIKER